MSEKKADWEVEMENYIRGMSEEEFAQFLVDTKYEFYSQPQFRKPILILGPEIEKLLDDGGNENE